jgi:hypothetical protein
MSALGQKQTCAVQTVMSALPPRADICKERKDRPEVISPKIHEFFNTLKLARSAVMTLPLSRPAASTQQV